jgi:hypothetical protein
MDSVYHIDSVGEVFYPVQHTPVMVDGDTKDGEGTDLFTYRILENADEYDLNEILKTGGIYVEK